MTEAASQPKILKNFSLSCAGICFFLGFFALLIYLFAENIFFVLPAPSIVASVSFMLIGIILFNYIYTRVFWVYVPTGLLFLLSSISLIYHLQDQVQILLPSKIVSSIFSTWSFFAISLFFFTFAKMECSLLKALVKVFFLLGLFLVSVIGLLGNFFPEHTLFIWPSAQHVSLISSIGFFITAVGILFADLFRCFFFQEILRKMIPVCIFIVFFVLGLLFSIGIWSEKKMVMDKILSFEVDAMGEDITSNAHFYLEKTNEMDRRIHAMSSDSYLQNEVENFLKSYPSCVAYAQLNGNWQLQAFFASDSIFKPFYLEERLKSLLSNLNYAKTFVPFFSVFPKYPNMMLVFYPQYEQNRLNGGNVFFFDLTMFLDLSLQSAGYHNCRVEVWSKQKLIFTHNVTQSIFELKNQTVEKSLTFGEVKLDFIIAPTAKLYKEFDSRVILVVSICLGGITAISLGGFSYFWQREIVHRKVIEEAERRLKESSDLIELALVSAEVGIWHWDISNDLVMFDDRMFALFGIKKEKKSLRFQDVVSFIYPEDSKMFEQQIQSFLESPVASIQIEYRVQWADQSIHFISSSGKIYRKPDGTPFQMTGVSRDISKEKLAAELLKKEQEKFQAFVTTTEEWIWEMDDKRKIMYSNPSVQSILGYTPEEVRGMDYVLLIASEAQKEAEQHLIYHFADRTGWTQKIFPWRCKDGRICWLESNAMPVWDVSGRFTGFIGSDRDITERKKVENLRREFISNVSHELRTPLSSIYGSIRILTASENSHFSEKEKELLNIANRNVTRLLALVNEILELGEIEKKGMDLHFEKTNIVSLAKEAIETNLSYAKQFDVFLRLETTLSAAEVYTDQRRLLQVFTNLLSNAIKFSHKQGTVTVRINEYDHNIKVEVEDRGVGISEEFQAMIFQQFAKEDLLKSVSGTGLGLSICKTIIQSLGGEIGFRSKKGEGSVFYFILPKQTQKI